MIPQTEVPVNDTTTQTPATQRLPLPSGPKLGFQSSEFATTIATAVAISSGHVPASYVPLVTAVAGVYVACRTLLKAVHVLGYAKQIPDLPQLPTENLK